MHDLKYGIKKVTMQYLCVVMTIDEVIHNFRCTSTEIVSAGRVCVGYCCKLCEKLSPYISTNACPALLSNTKIRMSVIIW